VIARSIFISAQETQPVARGKLVGRSNPEDVVSRGASQKWKCQVVIHPQVRFFVGELAAVVGSFSAVLCRR